MIYRSKAPLRLGLAGGGSDVSPYSDRYGGAILNVTIGLHSYAHIVPRTDGKIVLRAIDRKQYVELDSVANLPIDGQLDLHCGVYNRIVRDFAHKPLSFELVTYSDAPPGSGLGTSSTMVVAIIGAFVEWLQLPLGEYDIAHLAFEIERNDLAMAGGKQDQYAATFGGINFMEFTGENVIVNPLRIKSELLSELEHNLVLFYTNTSRVSADIISRQVANVEAQQMEAVEAMHQIKQGAFALKEALLRGDIHAIGPIFDTSWQHKKRMAQGITSDAIDATYQSAMNAGATGGKISGAGGGGFMMFYCPGTTRFAVADALAKHGGAVQRYRLNPQGLTTWTNTES